MIKASKFAIAMAAIASLGIATMKTSSAAPVTAGANMTIPSAMTEVVYRGYFVDDYGPYIVPRIPTVASRTGIPTPRSIRATNTTTIGDRRSRL
jgi:hypothetical protein